MSRTSIPAVVLYFQGAVNVAFGISGLLQPKNFEDAFGGAMPHPAATALSLQLLNMGALTLLAASRPSLHRRALVARICLHLLAGYLFWQEGVQMKTAAITDTGFAVLNAVTLLFV